tara:strand:+ start:1728 stop:1898 length:171 start_codon:yes stop_codon:yes gene_type:complete
MNNQLLRDNKSKAIISNNKEELNRILRERKVAEEVLLLKKEVKELKTIISNIVNER